MYPHFVEDNEDIEEYHILRNAYMARFGPRDRIVLATVEHSGDFAADDD